MAGLSMGGMETKMITLRNLDKFSHIGLFSGGSISIDDVNNTEGFKENVHLVFVSYGSKEVGGEGRPRRGGDPEANAKALREAGITSHYYVSPETAHEWQTWRRSLHEIAPLLFASERPQVSTATRDLPTREPAPTTSVVDVHIDRMSSASCLSSQVRVLRRLRQRLAEDSQSGQLQKCKTNLTS